MKLDADRYEHGTRARYVAGCRCNACRASNAAHYRERMDRQRELAASVRPSGPPVPGRMLRGGRWIEIERCPGANGATCVASGAWLRGQGDVCAKCVERATVWNGRVSPERARAHLLALSAAGVGYKAVAAASDVAVSALGRILQNADTIRAETERRVLAVDASALADHALVDGTATRATIERLRALGFTKEHLASLLGSSSRALHRAKGERVLAITAARAERIERRALAGELVPQRATVEASAERAWLATMLARGVSAKYLSERLGFCVARGSRGRMWPDNRDAVRALQAELREGAGLPEDWMIANDLASAGFGYTKDFSVITRKGRPAKAAPKRKPPKAARPRLTAAEYQRRRRARMTPEERRAEWTKAQRARRERLRANVGAAREERAA